MHRERFRAELMGMFFNPQEFIYAVDCLGLCERDGACIGRGSELNSWGCVLNPQEFIYAVNCWGFVKGMGLA